MTFLNLPKDRRLAELSKQQFPPFTKNLLVFPGWKSPYQIRSNRVLIRPYNPKGQTPNGIYLERREDWPVIFGHVLAIAPDNHLGLVPGDMIGVRHLTDQWMHDEEVQQPRYIGEVAEVSIVHMNSIQYVFDPAPVRLKL